MYRQGKDLENYILVHRFHVFMYVTNLFTIHKKAYNYNLPSLHRVATGAFNKMEMCRCGAEHSNSNRKRIPIHISYTHRHTL